MSDYQTLDRTLTRFDRPYSRLPQVRLNAATYKPQGLSFAAETEATRFEHDDPTRRSPFHFQRRRLAMLERPHMHTTLLVVPEGQPCPAVGDRVDLQRPLIATDVDELEWK